MHLIGGHQSRATFCPRFSGGGKQRIHTGDPIDIVRLPTERGGEGGFSGTGKGPFPLRERGVNVIESACI